MNMENTKFLKILMRALYKIDGFDTRIRIKPESMLKQDLNLNDVDITQIIMVLEQKYKIKIDDKDRHKVITVNDLNNLFNVALLQDMEQIMLRQKKLTHILRTK